MKKSYTKKRSRSKGKRTYGKKGKGGKKRLNTYTMQRGGIKL